MLLDFVTNSNESNEFLFDNKLMSENLKFSLLSKFLKELLITSLPKLRLM